MIVATELQVVLLPRRIIPQCGVRNPPVNEPTNRSIQVGGPQSGLVVINGSTIGDGICSSETWGSREETKVKLSRDSASATTFSTPGICTHDILKL